IMQFVGVLRPAVAYVCAVIHVGDENIFDAAIDLSLGLLHGLSEADNDQNHAGSSRDEPLAVDLFHVFNVNLVGRAALENNGVVLGKRLEGRLVVEWERRDDNTNADLKTAARAPFGFDTCGQFPEKIADRREDALLLDADSRIAEA